MENNYHSGHQSSGGRRSTNFNNDGQYRQNGQRPRFNRQSNNSRYDEQSQGEQRPQRPRFNSYRENLNYNNRQENDWRQDNRGRKDSNNRNTNYRQSNREQTEGGYRPRFSRTNESNNSGYSQERRPRQRFNNSVYSQRKQQEYRQKYEDPTKEIRLNKFLANAGICSRREADDFIQAGVITVNGVVVSELGAKVKPTDEVKFHDQPVRRERKVYILLNKPKNTVTTTDDPQERKTVIDIVKNACAERIYPVGRLDRNTTGVLLLTNDGDLAAKLTHPKYGKKKVYSATLDRDLTEDALNELRTGITLDGELIVPDAIEFTKDDRVHIGIEIHSGQNRVVRRIFEKVGYKVMQLDRVSFCGLTKKNVTRGKYRFLTPKEVSMLKMGAFEW